MGALPDWRLAVAAAPPGGNDTRVEFATRPAAVAAHTSLIDAAWAPPYLQAAPATEVAWAAPPEAPAPGLVPVEPSAATPHAHSRSEPILMKAQAAIAGAVHLNGAQPQPEPAARSGGGYTYAGAAPAVATAVLVAVLVVAMAAAAAIVSSGTCAFGLSPAANERCGRRRPAATTGTCTAAALATAAAPAQPAPAATPATPHSINVVVVTSTPVTVNNHVGAGAGGAVAGAAAGAGGGTDSISTPAAQAAPADVNDDGDAAQLKGVVSRRLRALQRQQHQQQRGQSQGRRSQCGDSGGANAYEGGTGLHVAAAGVDSSPAAPPEPASCDVDIDVDDPCVAAAPATAAATPVTTEAATAATSAPVPSAVTAAATVDARTAPTEPDAADASDGDDNRAGSPAEADPYEMFYRSSRALAAPVAGAPALSVAAAPSVGGGAGGGAAGFQVSGNPLLPPHRLARAPRAGAQAPTAAAPVVAAAVASAGDDSDSDGADGGYGTTAGEAAHGLHRLANAFWHHDTAARRPKLRWLNREASARGSPLPVGGARRAAAGGDGSSPATSLQAVAETAAAAPSPTVPGAWHAYYRGATLRRRVAFLSPGGRADIDDGAGGGGSGGGGSNSSTTAPVQPVAAAASAPESPLMALVGDFDGDDEGGCGNPDGVPTGGMCEAAAQQAAPAVQLTAARASRVASTASSPAVPKPQPPADTPPSSPEALRVLTGGSDGVGGGGQRNGADEPAAVEETAAPSPHAALMRALLARAHGSADGAAATQSAAPATTPTRTGPPPRSGLPRPPTRVPQPPRAPPAPAAPVVATPSSAAGETAASTAPTAPAAVDLAGAPPAVALKFARMLKVGVPPPAVRAKMAAEGVPSPAVEAVVSRWVEILRQAEGGNGGSGGAAAQPEVPSQQQLPPPPRSTPAPSRPSVAVPPPAHRETVPPTPSTAPSPRLSVSQLQQMFRAHTNTAAGSSGGGSVPVGGGGGGGSAPASGGGASRPGTPVGRVQSPFLQTAAPTAGAPTSPDGGLPRAKPARVTLLDAKRSQTRGVCVQRHFKAVPHGAVARCLLEGVTRVTVEGKVRGKSGREVVVGVMPSSAYAAPPAHICVRTSNHSALAPLRRTASRSP